MILWWCSSLGILFWGRDLYYYSLFVVVVVDVIVVIIVIVRGERRN